MTVIQGMMFNPITGAPCVYAVPPAAPAGSGVQVASPPVVSPAPDAQTIAPQRPGATSVGGVFAGQLKRWTDAVAGKLAHPKPPDARTGEPVKLGMRPPKKLPPRGARRRGMRAADAAKLHNIGKQMGNLLEDVRNYLPGNLKERLRGTLHAEMRSEEAKAVACAWTINLEDALRVGPPGERKQMIENAIGSLRHMIISSKNGSDSDTYPVTPPVRRARENLRRLMIGHRINPDYVELSKDATTLDSLRSNGDMLRRALAVNRTKLQLMEMVKEGRWRAEDEVSGVRLMISTYESQLDETNEAIARLVKNLKDRRARLHKRIAYLKGQLEIAEAEGDVAHISDLVAGKLLESSGRRMTAIEESEPDSEERKGRLARLGASRARKAIEGAAASNTMKRSDDRADALKRDITDCTRRLRDIEAMIDALEKERGR